MLISKQAEGKGLSSLTHQHQDWNPELPKPTQAPFRLQTSRHSLAAGSTEEL